MRSIKLLVTCIVSFLLLNSSSCQKGTASGIPYVPVNYMLTVGNPEFAALQAVGNSIPISGGSRGIIVYRFSIDEFRAYDRHCTFQVEDDCQVTVDNSNFLAVDLDCCNSKFQIIDGAPIDGPANIGLQQYNTQFDGNTLLITN